MLQMILVRNLAGKELTDEKIRDFRKMVLVQGLLISTIFLLHLFQYLAFPWHLQIAESIFFAVLGYYVFLMWDMLRNYTTSRLVVFLNFVLIMGVFVLGFLAVNPWMPMPLNTPYRLILTFIQSCLLGVESFLIYFTLREFFKRDLSMPMRLWGAACIYLMIGLAFGSAYELICILQIDCLGVDIPLQTMALMKRCEFSLMVLSGMDTPYASVSPLISSLATVEALWGQLFVIFIVGRLMVK